MCKNVIIIVVVIALIYVVWCLTYKKREHYGGPVKRIRRIPKETCYQICGQYYNDCMKPHYEGRLIDAEACMGRRNACVATCNYSDFQRL